MKKKIYFRADASTHIGYGHFIRTLALADMLKETFDCTFFTVEPTEYQKSEIARVCALKELSSGNKLEAFLKMLRGDEIVFLDNYFFTPEYEKAIKDIGCRLVVLSPSKPHHYADVVINYIDKELSHYSIEPYTKVVAGLEWSILREPFLRPFDSKKKIRGNVVISFGGTDQYNLTERVIAELSSSYCQLSVLCTSRVAKERRDYLSRIGVQVLCDIEAEEVARSFEEAEYAILSSSSVCLEALSRGAKVLAGYYVENQINIYNVLVENQFITGLGNLLEPGSFVGLEELMKNNGSNTTMPFDFASLKDRYNKLFMSIC